MKIKDGFMLREIAGSWVVIPIGKRLVEFNGLISLNESGALLWRRLEEGADTEELIRAIVHEYGIDETAALADVNEFITTVSERGLCE